MTKPKRPNPSCPIHNREMWRRITQYGALYICTVDSCDILKWGDGDYTTPANVVTRARRHAAHEVFDRLWKDGHMTRGEAYHQLSGHLAKHIRDTHIGLFDVYECDVVIKFANNMQLQILMEKFK